MASQKTGRTWHVLSIADDVVLFDTAKGDLASMPLGIVLALHEKRPIDCTATQDPDSGDVTFRQNMDDVATIPRDLFVVLKKLTGDLLKSTAPAEQLDDADRAILESCRKSTSLPPATSSLSRATVNRRAKALVKAKMLTRCGRGAYKITERGARALDEAPDPQGGAIMESIARNPFDLANNLADLRELKNVCSEGDVEPGDLPKILSIWSKLDARGLEVEDLESMLACTERAGISPAEAMDAVTSAAKAAEITRSLKSMQAERDSLAAGLAEARAALRLTGAIDATELEEIHALREHMIKNAVRVDDVALFMAARKTIAARMPEPMESWVLTSHVGALASAIAQVAEKDVVHPHEAVKRLIKLLRTRPRMKGPDER